MRIRLLACLVLAAVLLAACGPAGPAGAATVDGSVVPRDLLASEVRALAADQLQGDAQQRGQIVGQIQRETLSLLIQAQIIEHLADERGLSVDPARIDEMYDDQVEFAGGEEGLEQLMLQAGLTMVLFRDVLLPAQARIDLLREQIESEFATVPTRTVRHILVDSEAAASEVVAELEAGADFGQLAQERSADPGSGAAGGSLGPRPRGAYVQEFEDAVWAAELGSVVGPVQTQFGFHVLEVTEAGELAADELPPGQLDQLMGQELDRLLEEAFRGAQVEVAAGLGEWEVREGQLPQVVAPTLAGEGQDTGQFMPELEDLVGPAEE